MLGACSHEGLRPALVYHCDGNSSNIHPQILRLVLHGLERALSSSMNRLKAPQCLDHCQSAILAYPQIVEVAV